MNKKLLSFVALSFACLSMNAQSTVRKFTIPNLTSPESELTVYLPSAEAAAKANGRAIVDCPGGGYTHLAMDHEGHNWADFYNEQGIAFIVLKYRMPDGDRNIPLSDAYQAMRTVRDSCKVWNINPHNVGIQGFSAGGHLASAVCTHASMDVRPDFAVLFYPVISMKEKESHAGSCQGFLGDGRKDENLVKEWSSDQAVRRHLVPPTVIFLANDDRAVPPATNGAAYYTAMRKNGNQCAMFAYPSGGHGFGFRDTYKYHNNIVMELKQWLTDLTLPSTEAKKVACIGNSITDGSGIDCSEYFGYPAQLGRKLGSDYYVKNFGWSGRCMSNSSDRPYMKETLWKSCLEWNPDIVVIKLGTNDTKTHNWEGKAEKDYAQCMQTMIDSLKALPSNPRIILCSPVPNGSKHLTIRDSVLVNCINPLIVKAAKKNKIEYLDLHSKFGDISKLMQADLIHPTEKGAARMAELIADEILNPSSKVTSKKNKKK